MIEHWKAFGRFILSPTDNLVKKDWNFSVSYFAMITCVFLMILGFGFQIITAGFFQLEKSIVQNKDVFVLPDFLILIIGGILAPLFEELTFRLPLNLSFRNIIVAFISSIIVFIILSKSQIHAIYGAQQIHFSFDSLLIPTVLLVTLFSFKFISVVENKPHNYGMLIWVLAILFAISHGYENIHSIKSFTFIFLSSITQFLAGLYYSYLRLQFTIRLSIFIHCFWNTLLILLKILVESTSIQ